MKPDSAIARPITDDHRVEQPAHEAQPRRALAREPGPLAARCAARAAERAVEQRRDHERDQDRDPRGDPGSRRCQYPRHSWPRTVNRRHPASTPSGRCSTSSRPPPHLQAELRERTGIRHRRAGRRGRDPGRDRLLPRPPARGPRRRVAAGPARSLRGGDGAAVLDARVVLDALLASLRFFAYEDSAPALRALRARRASGPSSSPTGTCRCTSGLHETGLAAAARRRDRLRRGRLGQARRRDLRAALELAGARPEQAWHVGTRRRPTSRAPAPRASAPVLIARDGRRRRDGPIARRAHTLGACP